jgi:uncharacterized protein (DUF1810 family)
VLGQVDATKFRSCLTLFLSVDPADAEFGKALDKFFAGRQDERSLVLLRVARIAP